MSPIINIAILDIMLTFPIWLSNLLLSFDIKKFNDHLAATMACKMSIKANENITLDEMKYLLEDLRKCKNPFNCPHGRPTTIYYSKADLEKLFKRSGF